MVVPQHLCGMLQDLSGFFERTHEEYASWFVARVRDIGNEFLATDACKSWKPGFLKAKYGNPHHIFHAPTNVCAGLVREANPNHRFLR